ncbi:uncharacterized protein LOC115556985 isoform X1 [Gadus morhua]|uniref:uncharacterized protein LOC115556985 isoform X1 n=1 Tax=Gadus morhua TaxID=8049 RepID=UPI0011B474C4|nr:uncharacterized protein LOC115556985 isoform X1 [Gadus morhua]
MRTDIMETENGNGKGLDGVDYGKKDQRGEEAGEKENKYDKELTVSVELIGEDPITVMEFMRVTKEVCGELMACRKTGLKKYELTMGHLSGKMKLMDGFKIRGVSIIAKELTSDETVVSFLELPAYTTDNDVILKLQGWGVSVASPIKRRMWPGTNIADGTRFLKVKFNDLVRSLPYSTKFSTATGPQYFRVIHDRQEKVCRMCIQPGQILRDCPEFRCHRCHGQGQYARECGTDGEQRQQGGEGGSRETDVGEEEERPRGEGGEGGSGAEATEAEGSGVGVSGEGEKMDEEQEGMAEDVTAAEELTETGGEKEREENGCSADSAVRGTDEREERSSADGRGTVASQSLVMDEPVLDLRPVWRREGCWQRRSLRERCVRQHFQYWNSSHTSQPTSFSTSHLKV